jgi:hypothetical protein
LHEAIRDRRVLGADFRPVMQSLSSLNDEANLSVAAHIDSIPREGVR